MDDEPGLPLSQRSNFYALLDAAIACGTPCVHAPDPYTSDRGLDHDIIEYVEDNRTVANGLWLYQEPHAPWNVVIRDGKGPILTIVRPVATRQAA
jgi:hypothetical protein